MAGTPVTVTRAIAREETILRLGGRGDGWQMRVISG
jgi:hypothetical protein